LGRKWREAKEGRRGKPSYKKNTAVSVASLRRRKNITKGGKQRKKFLRGEILGRLKVGGGVKEDQGFRQLLPLIENVDTVDEAFNNLPTLGSSGGSIAENWIESVKLAMRKKTGKVGGERVVGTRRVKRERKKVVKKG